MPKRIRHSIKIQKFNRIKTKTADRYGRQKVLSMGLSVGIWRCEKNSSLYGSDAEA